MINNIPIAGGDAAAAAAAAAAFVQNLNFNTELNLENDRTNGGIGVLCANPAQLRVPIGMNY